MAAMSFDSIQYSELSSCNRDWPAKPKIFTIWLFIEKVFLSLPYCDKPHYLKDRGGPALRLAILWLGR